MNTYIAAAAAATVASATLIGSVRADPIVTIACAPPKGASLNYGVSGQDFAAAEVNHRPPPTPALRGPSPDSSARRFTIIVGEGGRNATVVWEDPTGQEEPESDTATVLTLSESQITVIVPALPLPSIVAPPYFQLFSFFPKFGTAFLAQQSWDKYKDTEQRALFSRCQYSGDLKTLPIFMAPNNLAVPSR